MPRKKRETQRPIGLISTTSHSGAALLHAREEEHVSDLYDRVSVPDDDAADEVGELDTEPILGLGDIPEGVHPHGEGVEP